MDGILYVIGVAGMFLLLIAPHEAGHFAFAKLFGVRVIEFSIGAGARLWSTTRGGTLYAIRAIPIMGYVRMGGMEGGDFEDPNGFHHKAAWQRLVILAAGPAANFVVAMHWSYRTRLRRRRGSRPGTACSRWRGRRSPPPTS